MYITDADKDVEEIKLFKGIYNNDEDLLTALPVGCMGILIEGKFIKEV
jgi:hypothetical protein